MFLFRRIRKIMSRIAAVLAAIVIAFFVGTADSEKEPTSETEGLILSTIKNETTVKSTSAKNLKDGNEEDYTYIILADEMTTINGKGASFSDNRVTISKGGTYLFKGGLSDGSICVDLKDKTEKVVLKFCGVGINSSESAAVAIKNSAKETVLELVDGTVNSISDTAVRGETYRETDEDSAAIFSGGDLIINGKGILNISAGFNKGIFSKKDLSIKDAVVNILSADDGIRSKDSVQLEGVKLKITSGGDGIRTRNDNEDKDGKIAVADSEIVINSELDGIQSEGKLIINKSKVDIISAGGSTGRHTDKGAPTFFEESKSPTEDKGLIFALRKATLDSSALEEILMGTTTHYGIIAEDKVTADESEIKVTSVDDAVYGEDIEVENCSFVLQSDDDGFHAKNEISTEKSEISILDSYEGFEGEKIEIEGGKLFIKAYNNGFDTGHNSEESVEIEDAYIHVDSDGKGSKSRSDIHLSGGTLIVFDSAHNDIFSDTYTVSSGTLLVLSDEPAAKNIKSEGIPVIAFTEKRGKNTFTVIADSKGEGVIGFFSTRKYKSVVFVSETLKKDEYYELYNGGKFSGEAISGVYTEGKYSGGTLIRKLSKPLINLDKKD